MSHHVLFSFSTGFSKAMRVPKGTHRSILDHLKHVEDVLGLKRTPTYTPEGEAQRAGWNWSNTPDTDMLAALGPKPPGEGHQWWLAQRAWEAKRDQMSCCVRNHNGFVHALYKDLTEWSKTKLKGRNTEVITLKHSVEFWGGLTELEWPRDLWDKDHFTDHMEHLFELLTSGKSRGVYLDVKPFNLKQADVLIQLFEHELDQWGYDLRFSVPLDAHLKPYDYIVCSHNGGYDWCSHCGPIHSDCFHARCRVCPRAKKGQCDLKNSHPAEFEEPAP